MGLARGLRCATRARDTQRWTEHWHWTPPRPISEGKWCTPPGRYPPPQLPRFRPPACLVRPARPQQHKDARGTSSGAGRAHSVVGGGKTRMARVHLGRRRLPRPSGPVPRGSGLAAESAALSESAGRAFPAQDGHLVSRAALTATPAVPEATRDPWARAWRRQEQPLERD